MKKAITVIITAAILLVGATGVFAATFKSPAEIYAGLKGITVEQAYAERAAGSTYGALAQQAGVLDEFKNQMLESRKALIQERVANGILTQEQADAIIKNIEENMANCDGTGAGARMGRFGAGFGKGGIRGAGAGFGCGFGKGFGQSN